MPNQVSLSVNGIDYFGWKSVEITRNLDQTASSFRFSVSERYPSEDHPLRIKPGDFCKVLIDQDLVVTGYVDSLDISYGPGSHSISVSGRSKTQDLIDCSALPPWSPILNKTIVQIADLLAEPYGVDIVDAVGASVDPIPKVKINPGETVFQVLSKFANQSGVLLTDDEKGRLLITRVGVARSNTRLELGSNILSGSGSFRHNDRFKEYRVIGQGSDTSENQISVEVVDEGVTRNRIHIIKGEGDLTLKKAEDRARWESSTRSGKSSQMTYTVQGWRQANGEIWKINQLITIKDEFLTVDGTFLISGVTFSLSDNGSLTTLEVVPPSSFDIRPTTLNKSTKGVSVWDNALVD